MTLISHQHIHNPYIYYAQTIPSQSIHAFPPIHTRRLNNTRVHAQHKTRTHNTDAKTIPITQRMHARDHKSNKNAIPDKNRYTKKAYSYMEIWRVDKVTR